MPCSSVMDPLEAGGERISVPPLMATVDLEEGVRSGSGSDLLCCGFNQLTKEAPNLASPAESSSIGKNSDEEVEEEGESEVQGPLRGGFKASLDSLEEALPMRRGISSFYNGKSKSFASLTDTSSCPSVKGIVKPETVYSRKRRNLLAHSLLSENNHHKTTKTSHLNKTQSGGISKKPTFFVSSSSSSRVTLALAVAMANNTSTNNNNNTNSSILGDHKSGRKARELGPSPLSPHVMGVHSIVGGGDDYSSPLSLRSFCHWRSFSLADLQQCQATVSSNLRSPDQVS